jgi:hypothetical protein
MKKRPGLEDQTMTCILATPSCISFFVRRPRTICILALSCVLSQRVLSQTAQPATRPSPAFDYSSPSASLTSLLRAVEEKNAQEYARVCLWPQSKASHVEKVERIRQAFDREASADALMALPQVLARATAHFEGELPARIVKARGIGKYHNGPDRPRFVGYLVDLPPEPSPFRMRLWFVQHDGEWKHLPSGWGFETWPYDLRTPKAACQSVVGCVSYSDYWGVYDLLAEPPAMGRERYVELMAKREALSDDKDRDVRQRIQSVLDYARVSPDSLDVELDNAETPIRARVWVLQNGEPGAKRLKYFEDFRRVADKWLWLPKPEYIWHVDPNDPDVR